MSFQQTIFELSHVSQFLIPLRRASELAYSHPSKTAKGGAAGHQPVRVMVIYSVIKPTQRLNGPPADSLL
jgi:hypothetical protein